GLFKAQKHEPTGPSVSEVFKDCDVCPEMVVVPAGSFMMGSPSGEKDRGNDEGPQHRVTIPASFAVGKYEITFTEWDACVAGGGCGGYRPKDNGWGRGEHPVINVSWKNAKSYVAWLSRKSRQEYRLLSEAEWEYAARAETATPFHFGLTISTDQANYDGRQTYGNGRKGIYRKKTVPVGGFPANSFGLFDMHGNVREWVEDCWHKNYSRAPSDGRAWTSGGDCSLRVRRGGSWLSSPRYLRAAFRGRDGDDYRYDDIGFRVARTLLPLAP
ncbi:MAG: formylglycine-generating enzyme family protein, partial [Alphaproteobacteria bacterium]